MNIHELATEVTKREGGKIKLSVAQVSEVLARTSDVFGECGLMDFLKLALAMRAKGKERVKAIKEAVEEDS